MSSKTEKPFLSAAREALFWSNVDKTAGSAEDACWPWKGATLWNGAGMFALDSGKRKVPGKLISAHRVAYLLTHPDESLRSLGKYVKIIQTCKNRACCRPEHLAKGKGGTKPLPEEQRLVSHGIHLRPNTLLKFQTIVAALGGSQRSLLEEMVDQKYADLQRQGELPATIAS